MSNYTTATAMLEALASAGVSHLFVNLGSDHPAIVEAVSKWQLDNRQGLRFLTAPNEFVGLSAAQGFFQVSGQMQAMLVHVDAGTLAMAGAIHNVSRARIPVIMMAGTSPITEEGEMRGTRNEFIHYIQDNGSQRNIVKGYSVYDHEIRTGKNAKQIILRAAQFAKSEPQGPAYLVASREALEEEIEPYEVNAKKWTPIASSALSPSSVKELGAALLAAENPVVITTYLGRDKAAVHELIKLCESLGIAVIEALPAHMNFPHTHPLYQGSQWSEGLKESPLDTADVVLVIDCDVPWIKSVFRPAASAKIYHIDCDPLKVNMSLFHIDTELSCQANARTALEQLNEFISGALTAEKNTTVSARTQKLSERHDEYIAQINKLAIVPTNDEVITPHYALSVLRSVLDDSCIVLSEGISNFRPIADVLMRTQPGSYFTSGGTALGWHGGAAIGAKLASPSSTIVAVTGDGSFLFSLPANVHWMARKYNAPFLTVILNNRGWKSPMLSAITVHKNGHSSKVTADQLNVTFDPSCDHSQVAVSAGAGFGVCVEKASEIEGALKKALEVVRGGRAAVVDIRLPKFEVGDRVG
ncbi:uncharacterized protein BHQ10_003742 [Talaromyces amestolkiae]|uniref:Uncharacterized protein n=1 Tax=Talaromyces amestolkiae TaxID=1196081 RepID=A0A364KW02_TALAM|nr:uncharacterized protein BHQ10_003742 [Talaromyces amestolkiae]RAO67730.1 hypothetical protein BHQ10_003742 [Talaromyces amestolkiae]